MDSITDKDIDRIYNRLEQTIDLSKIENKTDLYNAVKSNPKNRFWSRELNDFFFEKAIAIPIKEEQIAESISIGEDFAREKGIKLTEKITAKEYPRWGSKLKPAIVIRDNGRIKTWRYI